MSRSTPGFGLHNARRVSAILLGFCHSPSSLQTRGYLPTRKGIDLASWQRPAHAHEQTARGCYVKTAE